MKRTIVLVASLFCGAFAMFLAPAQGVASGGCPVSAQQASQILRYAVDLKNLGTMGCNYVGKRGLATVMVNVFPSAADASGTSGKCAQERPRPHAGSRLPSEIMARGSYKSSSSRTISGSQMPYSTRC